MNFHVSPIIIKPIVATSARCCGFVIIWLRVWNWKPLRKWVVDLPAGLVPGTLAANQPDAALGRRPTWTVRASRSCAERNCARAPMAQNRQRSRLLMSGWRSHDQLTWNANAKITNIIAEKDYPLYHTGEFLILKCNYKNRAWLFCELKIRKRTQRLI